LDAQLRCNLVPYTDVWHFHQNHFTTIFGIGDRFTERRNRCPKAGQFQVFLKGYKDATNFLKEHPWPDQNTSGLDQVPARRKKRWAENCRSPVDEEEASRSQLKKLIVDAYFGQTDYSKKFRQQLEKLVILDYIMRNTDRGLDNWMIR